ncbi:MAG: hypothetical protein K1Y36_28580 [Blastocatellia bacterium]|nr:hypothetical protein [Blastocatellia bacterium]
MDIDRVEFFREKCRNRLIAYEFMKGYFATKEELKVDFLMALKDVKNLDPADNQDSLWMTFESEQLLFEFVLNYYWMWQILHKIPIRLLGNTFPIQPTQIQKALSSLRYNIQSHPFFLNETELNHIKNKEWHKIPLVRIALSIQLGLVLTNGSDLILNPIFFHFHD